MIKTRIKQLKSQFKKFGIDGYIIPKNDEFFSEYASKDRLRTISNSLNLDLSCLILFFVI